MTALASPDVHVKQWAKRVALFGASLVAVVLVCDGLYRWLIAPERIVPASVGMYHDTLGWAMKPNSSASSGGTGKQVEYAINSAGLRDHEVTLEKPADVFRMVMVGNARTFGYGVPKDLHFTHLIEGYFYQVEALNLGVPGYGLDQALLALRSRGFQYQPDLVIAYVAHFDDHQLTSTNPFGPKKPQLEISGDSVVATNLPVPDRFDGLGFLRRVDLTLTELSPLYRDASGPAVRGLKSLFGLTPPEAEAAPAPDPVRAAAESAAQDDRLYEMALAILKQMDRETERAGAQLVLVTHLPRLHREAMDAGVISLDVSVALHNDYFALPRKLAHLNEPGNGVLAWELASFLMRQNLIPAAYSIDRYKTAQPPS